MMPGANQCFFQSPNVGPYNDQFMVKGTFSHRRSDSDTHTDDGFGDSGFACEIQNFGPEEHSRHLDQADLSVSHFYSPGFGSTTSTRQASGSSLKTDWSSEEWDDTYSVTPKTYSKMGAVWGPYPPGAFMVSDTGAPDGNANGLKRADTGATPDEAANSQIIGRQKNSMGNTRQRGSRTDPMSWDEGVTTVMVRQIPRKYPQWMLVEEVNRRGFSGLFDFIYLPFDFKKGANVGYGFLNFIETKYARAFRDTFDGNYLESNPTTKGKPLHVHPASVQGYDANYQHFAQTKTGQKQDPQYSPLFFPHLAKKRSSPPADNNLQAWQEQPRQTPPAQSFSAGYGQTKNQSDMSQLATAQLILQGQMMAAGPGNIAVPVTMMQVPNMTQGEFGVNTGDGGFCGSCGAKHLAEHNFCSFCGFRLSNGQ